MSKIKINSPKKIKKEWGYELWIHNSDQYCGKILHFHRGSKFSLHFHILKQESWYVSSGQFILHGIDTYNAEPYKLILNTGDCVDLFRGQPHQLETIEEGSIFEVSTQHFETDSYRIKKGDSQL